MLAYLRAEKPKVLIRAPPCTACGSWTAINSWKHPATHARQLRIGISIARTVCEACALQIHFGNEYVVENPQSSRMWSLPCFVALMALKQAHWSLLDQCQVGLVDPVGIPTGKATLFLSSNETLIYRLRRRCDNSHVHQPLEGAIAGVSRCRFAQRGPVQLCRLLVLGIVEYKTHLAAKRHAFPAIVNPGTCPGCRAHAYKDARHSRVDGACRFANVAPIAYPCPACAKGANRINQDHESPRCMPLGRSTCESHLAP